MPDPFLDRLVQYPKRFNIQADGADGTDIVGTIDGKKVAFTVEPGVITTPGTSLNAEELNKRIVGDFEDKTFTELRTLLDTLNIDKDQNANMVVNKILMRTLYQQVPNGDFAGGTIGWSSSSGATFTVSNGIATLLADSVNDAIFRTITSLIGNDYFIVAKVKSTSNSVYLSYAETDAGLAFHSGSGEYELLVLKGTSISNIANGLIVRDARSSGWDNVLIDYVMVIPITSTHLEGLAVGKINSQIGDYVEGKAKTVDPHLLTVGKNLVDNFSNNVGGAIGTSDSEFTLDIWKVNTASASEIIDKILEVTATTENMVATRKKTIIGQTYTLSIREITSLATALRLYLDGVLLTNFTVNGNVWETFFTATKKEHDIMIRLNGSNVGTKQFNRPQIESGLVISEFAEYNTNKDNKFGFQTEGNSVTNTIETIEDTIELRNNRYYHIKRILEDEANFQAIGGVSGNWAYDIPNAQFEMDFATLGIDPNFVQGATSLARIIIDGKRYSNDLSSAYKFIFNDGTNLLSGNPGILFIDPDYVTTATLAAFIAAATEVVFDFYMKPEDWEENVIAATGFTVIEENGTIVEENDEEIAYEMETEIPVNIPASIEENTKDIRRLFNIKNEYVVLEDFSSDNLDIPSTGTPGIFTTDRMSEIYSKYIIVYELAHLEANQGLGYQFMEFVNPYFAEPNSVVDEDIKKKLGRIRQAAAGGDLFLDFEFTLYFLVATPNQLGIGSGASYQDQKKTAATNVYFGKIASTSIDVVALLGVKSNE